jgi:hypothetical protein
MTRSARLPKWLPGWLALLAILPAVPNPASATGTLYCIIDDRNLSFDLSGNTSIDDGTIVEVHHAALKLKPVRLVKTAAEFAVRKDDIFHQWDFDNELRFAVRLNDPGQARSIVLAIVTVHDERLEKYVGHYVLKLAGAGTTKSVKGRVSRLIRRRRDSGSDAPARSPARRQ